MLGDRLRALLQHIGDAAGEDIQEQRLRRINCSLALNSERLKKYESDGRGTEDVHGGKRLDARVRHGRAGLHQRTQKQGQQDFNEEGEEPHAGLSVAGEDERAKRSDQCPQHDARRPDESAEGKGEQEGKHKHERELARSEQSVSAKPREQRHAHRRQRGVAERNGGREWLAKHQIGHAPHDCGNTDHRRRCKKQRLVESQFVVIALIDADRRQPRCSTAEI